MPVGTSSVQNAALEFKSASLTVPVLHLLSNDLDAVERQLAEKVAQSQEFFHNSPLLIDLQGLLRKNLDVVLEDVVALVRAQGLMPIGIRGGSRLQHEAALAMHLPVHAPPGNVAVQNARAARAARATQPEEQEPEPQPERRPEPAPAQNGPVVENKVISQPIRSGQRVYARGDLTVTATVSAGAEIMAEGNIHVYGSLRGRALAGVRGDTSSRIFCMDLQAELISIAGIYQLREELSQEAQSKPVTVSLENQTLIIKDI